MCRLRCIDIYTLSFICILGLHLVSCRQETPQSMQSPPPASSTKPTQSTITPSSSISNTMPRGEDWEQLQLPFSCSILAFTPDWQWLACRDLPSIWTVSITQGQAGAPSLVAKDEDGKHFSLLSSPPGRSVFVIESWDSSSTSILWLVQPSDPDRKVHLYEGQDPVLVAHWAPDGNHLVLVHDSGYATLVKDLGTDSQLIVPISHLLRPTSEVAWSPSSDQIFYSGQTEVSGKSYIGGWILDVNSLESNLLFTNTWPFEPTWSPDGETLVTLKWPEAKHADWEMCLLSPDGVHLDTITLHGLQRAGEMIWSPDGTRIALIVTELGKGDKAIGLIELASKEFTAIPVTRLSKAIGWSEDGNAVIVLTFDHTVKKVPVKK